MFKSFKKLIAKGGWHSLAAIIVLLVAGPEIMMSIELMAMVELLGASTFVLMYVAGFKLFFAKLASKYKKFERHSVLVIPPLSILKQMPSLAFHAIPERTVSLCFFGFIALGMGCIYTKMLIGA